MFVEKHFDGTTQNLLHECRDGDFLLDPNGTTCLLAAVSAMNNAARVHNTNKARRPM
jgi:hypothetical protein